MKALLIIALLASAAHAETELYPTRRCSDPLHDVVATPLREYDGQRSTCARTLLSAELIPRALIDTPGFHGEIEAALVLGARLRVRDTLELGAQLRPAGFAFVQNAVNKATEVTSGPLVLGALWSHYHSRVALAGALEVPFTRFTSDTTHLAGSLDVVTTLALSRTTNVHGRLGMIGMRAWSLGGSTGRIALRAGIDGVRRFGTRWSLGAGAELQAGWHDGLDTVLVRGAVQRRIGQHARGQLALGLPLGGDERTNAVIVIGAVWDR